MTDNEPTGNETTGQSSPADAPGDQAPSGIGAMDLLPSDAQPKPTWQAPLAFVASGATLTVAHEGTLLAHSSDAIIVHEQGHHSVPYFPRKDVRLAHLAVVSHSTHCPRKGNASYFAVGTVDGPLVAWTYETPIPVARILKNYVAFYADKVELCKEA